MRFVRIFIGLCAAWLALIRLISPAAASVSLDLALLAPSNLQVFFLEDLNVSGNAPAAEVFRITLISTEPTDLECYAAFSMQTSQTLVASGASDPFILRANSTLVLTNLDLTAKSSPYELRDYEVSDQAKSIEDKLLETGYFPSGAYILRLELYNAATRALLAADEATAIITNPFSIQLISPPGTPAAPAPIAVTTPVFVWSSQATQFLLKVCELTSPEMDAESVMESRPHYETDPLQPLTGQSFAYPTAGVRPLESGHTYYWQVISLVQTSGGRQEYPSPVGAFSIIHTLDPQSQRIWIALQRILGSSGQTALNELTGFQPNGTIHLDGLGITIEHLEEIASKFEQGAYRTASIRIE